MISKNYEVYFSDRFYIQLNEDVDYYNSKGFNLGLNYYNDVIKTIEKLVFCPTLKIQYKDVRCIMLRKFKHRIHYRLDEENRKIYIKVIIHTSKNPETNWL
jgi:hypothetical protein